MARTSLEITLFMQRSEEGLQSYWRLEGTVKLGAWHTARMPTAWPLLTIPVGM